MCPIRLPWPVVRIHLLIHFHILLIMLLSDKPISINIISGPHNVAEMGLGGQKNRPRPKRNIILLSYWKCEHLVYHRNDFSWGSKLNEFVTENLLLLQTTTPFLLLLLLWIFRFYGTEFFRRNKSDGAYEIGAYLYICIHIFFMTLTLLSFGMNGYFTVCFE